MRFIKTNYGAYVKIPEHDDSLFFTYEEVGDGFMEILMSCEETKTVWLTKTYTRDEGFIKAVLDKMMMFIVDDEFDVIDMDVIVELTAQKDFEVDDFEF